MALSFKKLSPFFCALIVFSVVISCNSTTEKEMDHFIAGKITTIDRNEDYYGIVLKTASDSTVLSMARIEDFKNNWSQFQQLQVGQKISIKGVVFCTDSWKMEERCPMVIIKQMEE